MQMPAPSPADLSPVKTDKNCVPFGFCRPHRLAGFPKGKKTIHRSEREFVTVSVKRFGITRRFYVKEVGETWIPFLEIVKNDGKPDHLAQKKAVE